MRGNSSCVSRDAHLERNLVTSRPDAVDGVAYDADCLPESMLWTAELQEELHSHMFVLNGVLEENIEQINESLQNLQQYPVQRVIETIKREKACRYIDRLQMLLSFPPTSIRALEVVCGIIQTTNAFDELFIKPEPFYVFLNEILTNSCETNVISGFLHLISLLLRKQERSWEFPGKAFEAGIFHAIVSLNERIDISEIMDDICTCFYKALDHPGCVNEFFMLVVTMVKEFLALGSELGLTLLAKLMKTVETTEGSEMTMNIITQPGIIESVTNLLDPEVKEVNKALDLIAAAASNDTLIDNMICADTLGNIATRILDVFNKPVMMKILEIISNLAELCRPDQAQYMYNFVRQIDLTAILSTGDFEVKQALTHAIRLIATITPAGLLFEVINPEIASEVVSVVSDCDPVSEYAYDACFCVRELLRKSAEFAQVHEFIKQAVRQDAVHDALCEIASQQNLEARVYADEILKMCE